MHLQSAKAFSWPCVGVALVTQSSINTNKASLDMESAGNAAPFAEVLTSFLVAELLHASRQQIKPAQMIRNKTGMCLNLTMALQFRYQSISVSLGFVISVSHQILDKLPDYLFAYSSLTPFHIFSISPINCPKAFFSVSIRRLSTSSTFL